MSIAVLEKKKTGSPVYLAEHEECDSNFIGSTIVYLSNSRGKLEIKVCDGCGYEDVKCLHLNTEVDTYNLKLNCKLCGE